MSEVRGHDPRCSLQLIWVHLTGLQPLQIQHVLLTVGQLVNAARDSQYNVKEFKVAKKSSGCSYKKTVTSFSSQ